MLLRLLKADAFKSNQLSYYRLRESFIIFQIKSYFLVDIMVDTIWSINAVVNKSVIFVLSSIIEGRFHCKFIKFYGIRKIQELNNSFTSESKFPVFNLSEISCSISFFNSGICRITNPHKNDGSTYS